MGIICLQKIGVFIYSFKIHLFIYVFQRRLFLYIITLYSSKTNFRCTLCTLVASPSRFLMNMVGISFETPCWDKKFKLSLISLGWKLPTLEKNETEHMRINWSRVLSLLSVFSSTNGWIRIILVPFDLSFKDEDFDAS